MGSFVSHSVLLHVAVVRARLRNFVLLFSRLGDRGFEGAGTISSH